MEHIYADYYGDASLTKWRELSAVDKAANIIKLWSIISRDMGPSIVEVGSGDGAIIQELDGRGFGQSYVGFEISESGISCAQKRQYSKPVRFELFEGAHLPVPDKSFDLAVLSHVLEHVEEPRALLREAARAAKYLFVEVPLELNARTPRDFHSTTVGHINLYNPLLIRQLMQSADLQILAEKRTCPSRAVFTFRRRNRHLPGILHWFAKVALLRIAPVFACCVWTYNGCLIARSLST